MKKYQFFISAFEPIGTSTTHETEPGSQTSGVAPNELGRTL